MKCSFCKIEAPEGRRKIYVTKTGQISYFCSSKCQRNLLNLKRKPLKQKWVTKSKKPKEEKK